MFSFADKLELARDFQSTLCQRGSPFISSNHTKYFPIVLQEVPAESRYFFWYMTNITSQSAFFVHRNSKAVFRIARFLTSLQLFIEHWCPGAFIFMKSTDGTVYSVFKGCSHDFLCKNLCRNFVRLYSRQQVYYYSFSLLAPFC